MKDKFFLGFITGAGSYMITNLILNFICKLVMAIK